MNALKRIPDNRDLAYVVDEVVADAAINGLEKTTIPKIVEGAKYFGKLKNLGKGEQKELVHIAVKQVLEYTKNNSDADLIVS